MLCDQLMLECADQSGCDIRPLLPRLRRAQKFVLTPEFAAVAEELADDYTGLVRIFERCRLPYPDVWFEVAQADRPRFSAANMHAPQVQVKPKKVGFLLTATREDLSAWKAHLYWNFEGMPAGSSCSTALLATVYDMTHPLHHYTELGTSIEDDPIHQRDLQFGPIKIQQFGQHEGWVRSGTDVRLAMVNHTDLTTADHHYVLPGLATMSPQQRKELSEISRVLARADWAGEAAYLLAVIGLLNARNAVEMEPVDLSKLNRARLKNDKRPLFEHKLLKIARRVHKRVYPDGKGHADHAPMREHFVRSHWKHRKTGIFFWRPFVRGDAKQGKIEKDYELK
jgi:hypothetical protein